MKKGELILYLFDTEVDRLKINILSYEGLTLKVDAYKKWKGVEGNDHYTIIVHETDQGEGIKGWGFISNEWKRIHSNRSKRFRNKILQHADNAI